MARTGKIARLPVSLREEINQRLLCSEPAHIIAAWLNAKPEVQAILARHFRGKPIWERNIYNWRDAGFREWLVEQESLDVMEKLRRTSDSIGTAHPQLADQIGINLTAHLAVAVQHFDAEDPDRPAVIRQLGRLCTDLCALRRIDHKAETNRLQSKKLTLKTQKLEQQKI